tara:strand:- start:493 stop:813 length:321 start_codon:yes stop_codon:yes gene_type:complete
MLDNSLQPSDIEQRLESAGFEGIELKYGVALGEWFMIFRTFEVYRSFLTSVIDSPLYEVMEKSNSQLYTKERIEPLEFGVITHIHHYDDWEDWEHFFHSLFTIIRV